VHASNSAASTITAAHRRGNPDTRTRITRSSVGRADAGDGDEEADGEVEVALGMGAANAVTDPLCEGASRSANFRMLFYDVASTQPTGGEL
jgi:hypothetical protein